MQQATGRSQKPITYYLNKMTNKSAHKCNTSLRTFHTHISALPLLSLQVKERLLPASHDRSKNCIRSKCFKIKGEQQKLQMRDSRFMFVDFFIFLFYTLAPGKILYM